MFGDLLGNLEQQQQEMQDKLATIDVHAQAGDGAIKIQSNALGEIINISIDKEKIDLNETEELEDLLLVAINRVLDDAAEIEAKTSQEAMKNMMPPGLGGLGSLFGK